MIQHIHACACGHEEPCKAEELSLGRVFQCPACQQVWAHVYPKGGGRAWIKVNEDDVVFYDLLGKRRKEGET